MNSPGLPAFGKTGAILQVQSVLFNNSVDDVERCIAALARATELAVTSGVLARVVVKFGDSGPLPSLDGAALARLRRAGRETLELDYDYFSGNLGSARGHNRLARAAKDNTDFIWVQNPDVVVSPRIFEDILEPFSRHGIGQVEAKQLPIEHPKDYDPITGETPWATTACVMIPLSLFRELGGFDDEAFFLYCDDVDFSYRVREAGYRVIFQPAAICFHDKRLAEDASWQPSGAETYYSAEAGLMMAHKWSRPDLVEHTLSYFAASGDTVLERAAKTFLDRRTAGKLPCPRDPDHVVAEFHGHFYAKHRYGL